MNSTANVLRKFIDKSVYYCLISILGVSVLSFVMCNVIVMWSYSDTFSFKEWIWIVPAIAFVFFSWMFGRGFHFLNFYISPFAYGFVFSNICFIIVLLTYNTQPASDWAYVWRAANDMAHGNFTSGITNGEPMHEIPHQLGLACVESLFIRVFGPSYTVLKVLNLVLLNIITWSTYHFAKRKASEEVAYFAYVSACMFLCYLMTVGQFSNHQLGFVLLYLSLYLYEKGKIKHCLFAGLITAFLNFVRPLGIMVVLNKEMCCKKSFNKFDCFLFYL